MILPFVTKINGKPNFFVQKIITGLYRHGVVSEAEGKSAMKEYYEFIQETLPQLVFHQYGTKIHTIREDNSDRWKEGKMIDFFINNRTKKAFRFAPKVPVVSVQSIFMTYREKLEITIANTGSYIGGSDFYCDCGTISKLAKNDGFSSVDEFTEYFLRLINENGKKTGNYYFSGKIIHWTNFNYSNERDLEECIGCGKFIDYEIMVQDDASEDYCPACWEHFKDDLKAEYQKYIEENEDKT